MNKNTQTECQTTQLIEKEYINSMLGIDSQCDTSHDNQQPPVDYREAYESNSIDCQVFDIAGLKIAVPDMYIKKILMQQQLLIDKSDKSQSAIYAGTIEHDNKIIEIIAIENLLMNGITNSKTTSDDINKPKNIILIKGSTTGLTCNERLANQIILKENIHWRDDSSQRIWLAGTITQMGLALVDISGLIELTQSPA